MKISTKGRYALRVLVDLAINGMDEQGHPLTVSIREIASRQNISVKYLEGIVSRLVAAGYVKSTRGKYGGYSLVREPKDYSMYEILEAAEDSLALVYCLESEENECPQSEYCATLPLWEHMQGYIVDYMRKVTLEDVVKGDFSRFK